MTLDSLASAVGTTFGPTEWQVLGQERIAAFADVTGDRQWIHVDPARAAASPFGGTIAHGYLTLSLIAAAHFELATFPDEPDVTVINYGLDKVRFLAPVPSGSRVRTTVAVTDVQDRRRGRWILATRSTVEIEGIEKPALIADALFLLVRDT
ncbi:MAG: MaoC family dehydratase [Trueperaceae bacterium]|nr:MAG: MaoC family dehydratase [Trueperaceae bacterium]